MLILVTNSYVKLTQFYLIVSILKLTPRYSNDKYLQFVSEQHSI